MFQDAVEKVAGLAFGLIRTPGALVSGTLVGAYHGARSGANAEHVVTPKSVSLGMVSTNVVEGLIKAGAGGFWLLGPTGAAIGLAQEAAFEAADVFMFIKGGAANEIGTKVHTALSERVAPGEGLISGGAKGLAAGAVSATKAGAISGFNEGKGAIAGTFEAVREIPSEAKLAKPLPSGVLRKIGGAVAGVVGAALAAPAGLAFGLLKSTSDSGEPPSQTKRKLAAVGSAAAAGAAIGYLAGPLGIAVGGALGAVVGLVGGTSREEFSDGVAQSIARSQHDDTDLQHEVGNKYRDIIQGTGVGGLAGLRQGWDSGVSLFTPAS